MGNLQTYRNQLRAAGLASLLLIGVQQMPLEFPYLIQSQGQVVPIREWKLTQAANGDLKSSFKDNRTGKLSSFGVTAFQRGNESRFSIHPSVYEKAYIRKGDTIATMYSNKGEEQLTQLQGDSQVQLSEILRNQANEHEADIRGFTDRLILAREGLALQQKLTQRSLALYQDSLISVQEYELALNLLRTRELEFKVAKKSLASFAHKGESAQVSFMKARNKAVNQQIRQIKNELQDLTLVAPLSGVKIEMKPSTLQTEEVLLSVADQSAYIVIFPVQYAEKDYVTLGQSVRVSLTGTIRQCVGKIIGIDNTSQIINGEQAFFATAIIEQQDLPVVSNTYLRVSIVGESVTVQQYLARGIKSLIVY